MHHWADGRSKEAGLMKWLFILSSECCQTWGEMRERRTGVAEIPSKN